MSRRLKRPVFNGGKRLKNTPPPFRRNKVATIRIIAWKKRFFVCCPSRKCFSCPSLPNYIHITSIKNGRIARKVENRNKIGESRENLRIATKSENRNKIRESLQNRRIATKSMNRSKIGESRQNRRIARKSENREKI